MEQKATKAPCKAKKPDGKSCKLAALPGSEFCFFHDPEKAGERRAAQSLGGSRNRMKTLAADAPDVKLGDSQAVINLIEETVNDVRKGKLDPRVANSIGYLINVLIKARDQGELEERLSRLEAKAKERE
jgi:hypothetical protein